MSKPLVLVTGATGFIGSHCIRQLLAEGGYRVRGTVRNLTSAKSAAVRECLGHLGELELVQGDLTVKEGWDDICKGCTYVLHVASPVEAEQFCKDTMMRYLLPEEKQQQAMDAAVKGTIFVIDAAKKAGVKRVVLTSSIAAMVPDGWAEPWLPTRDVPGVWDPEKDWENYHVTHESWSNEDLVVGYVLAKTKAEKAAWESVRNSSMELSVINPGYVYGPPLHKQLFSESLASFDIMMHQPPDTEKSLDAWPRVMIHTVDVRDVAVAHVRAMALPQAAGNRYPLAPVMHDTAEIPKTVAKKFEPMGYDVLTAVAPQFMFNVLGVADPLCHRLSRTWGRFLNFDHTKTKADLGIEKWIDPEKTLFDSIFGLVATGRYQRSAGFTCDNPEFAKALESVPVVELTKKKKSVMPCFCFLGVVVAGAAIVLL